MAFQQILLRKEMYENFVNGQVVEVRMNSPESPFRTGEHVMVHKDTVAAATTATVPVREDQADYIGIEGRVLHVERSASNASQRLLIKKL